MTERNRQFLAFYQEQRIDDQLRFYSGRSAEFDRATGQVLALSAMLLGFATAASALAGTHIRGTAVWSALAVILPAACTALAAYNALYAFEQQAQIYNDARRAVMAASRPKPSADASPADIAEMVQRVEAAFRQEGSQWGQLATELGVTATARRPPEAGDA
jgi:hypothetical protein